MFTFHLFLPETLLNREYCFLTPCQYTERFTWSPLESDRNQFGAAVEINMCIFWVLVECRSHFCTCTNSKVNSVSSQSHLLQTSGAGLEAFLGFVPVSLRNLLYLPPLIRLLRLTVWAQEGWTEAVTQKVGLRKLTWQRYCGENMLRHKRTQGNKLVVLTLLSWDLVPGR